MRDIAPGVEFSLPQGHMLHLAPAAPRRHTPWRVRVQAGAVWLTWPGCTDDVFLRAGESAQVPAGRQVLLQAEPMLAPGAALLQWDYPPAAGPAARHGRPGWVNWLRGLPGLALRVSRLR